MDNNENNNLNDFQEQYDILIEEEQENQKKKAFWILFFCLIIILFSVLGATYSYYRIYTNTEKKDINIDTDGDGKPDLNVDLNSDGICDINCDTNHDGKPDINIDYNKDLKAHFNLDLDGDGIPETNLINQNNKNGLACSLKGECDLNCDTNDDNHPDINVDLDGDGKPDINIDTDCDGKPNLNLDTDGDGKPDSFVDTDGDGVCDLNCGNDNPEQEPNPKPNPKPEDPIVEVKPSDDDKGILYINYVKGVNIENMLPDTTTTQAFVVENQSDQTIVFNLNWLNVVNEISVEEGFTYQIKRDGIAITSLIPVPKNATSLLSNIVIPAKTTYSYEIDYTFHNLEDKDQTMDQNKTFSAEIGAEIVQ